MNKTEFEIELFKIEHETWQKVTALVAQARIEEGLDMDNDKPMPYADDPNWQRRADALAELCGWIYDRMNGRNRTQRGSMTKKIRKALGYLQP